MKVLHPFMPFLSEEVWSQLRERSEGQDIIVSAWPTIEDANEALTNQGEQIFRISISDQKHTKQQRHVSKRDFRPCH